MSTAHEHYEPPSIPFEDMPARLKRARHRMGWDQADIALRLGIHPRTVANYETGHTEPKLALLLAWAQVTNVPIDWLTFGITPEAQCPHCGQATLPGHSPQPRGGETRNRCFSTEPQVSELSNVVPVDFGAPRLGPAVPSTDATVHEFPPAE